MPLRRAIFLMCLVALPAMSANAASAPSVTVRLSPGIRSETVSISYVLYGRFGAVGASVAPQRNVDTYRINPVHDGKLAASIKGVIYASGCEFGTFNADILGDAPIEKFYECTTLPTVWLVGHISLGRRFHDRDLEIVVKYVADWQCAFFELSLPGSAD